MSRIDELIAEQCPAGAQRVVLGDVANITTGSRPSNEALAAGGSVSYLNGGVSPSGFVADSNTPGDVVAIPSRGSVGIVGYSHSPFWCGPLCYRIASKDAQVLHPRFLYYALKSIEREIVSLQQTGSIPALNKAQLIKVTLPLPPLEVQREVVRILDHFTELEAKLEAELEARRRQHDTYRAQILAPGPRWRTVALSEVSEIFDGPHATPKKTASGPWYLSISSLKDGNVDLAVSAHLAPDNFPQWTRRVAPRFGDTLFSYETRVGQAGYWDRNDPAALGRRMGLLRPRDSVVVPKFLTIAYLSPEFQKLIETKTVRGSTVDRIPIGDMPNWPISIPTMAEQHRIIALLDKFDALVNDISVGLPAELAARRKQYEHYRDRLLTFKELAE